MSARESYYLHGTSPVEQRRLTRLNELLNDSSLARLGLAPGERVLDLGSGLGQLSRRMAQAVAPGGRVLGIERSAEQIAEAQRQAREAGEDGPVEFRQGDALTPPLAPDEWGTFDLAHARFLLEHLPDPLAAVRVLGRAVRPGGRVVLEDDDHAVLRLWPEPEGFVEVWRAYCDTYAARGNDPYVGRRLFQFLRQAGLEPHRNDWVFFGTCSGDADFPHYVENLASILEGSRDDLFATGRVTAGALDRTLSAIRDCARRDDAAFWYARAWALGIRPG